MLLLEGLGEEKGWGGGGGGGGERERKKRKVKKREREKWEGGREKGEGKKLCITSDLKVSI